MNKSTPEVLNLEQAARVTRLYLSTVALAPSGTALRGRIDRGLGPPIVTKKYGSAPNAPILLDRADVVAWCEAQLPERVRLALDVLRRAQQWEARYASATGSGAKMVVHYILNGESS